MTFFNARGQLLRGVLHEPPLAPASGVILCHGMESNKQSEKIVALARELAELGVLALRFDFASASDGDRFAEITYSGEVEDLRAAYRFLLRRPLRKIGLFGSSMGGTVALLFAAEEKSVAALVTLAAPLHPRKILEHMISVQEIEQWRRRGYVIYHGRKIHTGLLDDLKTLDVPQAAARVRCPTLVIHGDRDDTVPVSEAYELFALLAEPKELFIAAGADHRFSDAQALQDALRAARRWMRSHLP
ncbi:MAG TPA: alpha/beta fold hydrolase [Candidatus Acidoferrales bacterium]|nr:alpha/beta fold hydrolase [Candidatus Acidoferrales bacterium]